MRKKDIIEEFNKSKLFIDSLEKALVGLSDRHKKNIGLFLEAENLEFNNDEGFNKDDIIEIIAQVRGNIHHFSQKSPKK